MQFAFQGPGLKVKVTVAIFRKKNFVIALAPTFIDGLFMEHHTTGVYDTVISRAS